MKDCENCFQKQRADYWHRIASILLGLIGGVVGGLIGGLCIRLFCN